jgi:hypothetical protein
MVSKINITPETHKKLTSLKKEEESFNDVITHLLDFEDKFNPLAEIHEYEYIFNNQSRLFRVTFGEKVTIEYYSMKTHTFESNIQVWNDVEKVSEEELHSFIRFIVKESSVYVLYEMDNDLIINDVCIKRV